MPRQRREEKTRALTQRNSHSRVLLRTGALSLIVLVAGVIAYLVLPERLQPPLGREVSIEGIAHIRPGQPHPAYSTYPPTSGVHYEGSAEWGIYDNPIPDEIQVHNLEHGGILVQYNCQGCDDLVENLRKVVARYNTKVILAPYPKMDSRIALTAWG